MNDMNTVGFTGPLDKGRTVLVGPGRVTVCGGRSYGCVQVMPLPFMLLAFIQAMSLRSVRAVPACTVTAAPRTVDVSHSDGYEI